MKLFFLTNTLNLDNILTSECLSPMSVYPLRNFGYNSFEAAPLSGKVDTSNSILLFARIPFYRVDSFELECAPMILEIEDENLNTIVEDVSITKDESVYLVKNNQSIALTPANCRILFTSERGYKMARLKCQDSKCNKLWEYFEMKIVNIDKNLPLEDLLKNISIRHTSSPNVTKEILINRKKGLLWGYALGSLKSIPAKVAKLRAIQKELYNNVSSIINAGGKVIPIFIDRIKELDKAYREIDPIRNEILLSWDDALREIGLTETQKNFFFDTLKMSNSLFLAYAKYNGVALRTPVFTGETVNWLSYQEALTKHTQSIVDKALESRNDSVQLDAKFINTDRGLTTFENTELDNLFASIIEEILLSEENYLTIEEIRIDKLAVVKRFNEIYKKHFNDSSDYKTSQTYQYMSSIVHCIRDNESFNPLSTEDILLQSIAAFILKGDSFEDMMTYMVEKGIPTFEYATAMWCACTGYVDLARTIIYSIPSKKLNISSIYNQVDSLVYNRGVKILLNKQPQIVTVGPSDSTDYSFEKFQMDERFLQFNPSAQKKVEAAVKMETDVQNTKAFLRILDSLIPPSNSIYKTIKSGLKKEKYSSREEFVVTIEEICRSIGKPELNKKVKSKRWKGQPYTFLQAIERAVELESKRGDPHALLFILDNTFDETTKEYDAILSILEVKQYLTHGGKAEDSRLSTKSKEQSIMGSLFSSQDFQNKDVKEKTENSKSTEHISMLKDTSWISECEEMISIFTGKRQFREDSLYVIKEHLSGKSKAEKENEDIIKHLYFLLMKKAKESKREYNLSEIMYIETYLKKKYAIQ